MDMTWEKFEKKTGVTKKLLKSALSNLPHVPLTIPWTFTNQKERSVLLNIKVHESGWSSSTDVWYKTQNGEETKSRFIGRLKLQNNCLVEVMDM